MTQAGSCDWLVCPECGMGWSAGPFTGKYGGAVCGDWSRNVDPGDACRGVLVPACRLLGPGACRRHRGTAVRRCGGVTRAGRPCRAWARRGTAWCDVHHPFDHPVEAVGGPWDGGHVAAPCVLGHAVPLERRPGAPGNAGWVREPHAAALGTYVLVVTRGPDVHRVADRDGVYFCRKWLKPGDIVEYWWRARQPDASVVEGDGGGRA